MLSLRWDVARIIMQSMKLKELGEFGLIEILSDLVAKEAGKPLQGRKSSGFRLLLGIGDDTAAWKVGKGTELLTTDTMVEGVHFVLERTGWLDLGWKMMAVNYSDIASMGGQPLYAIVTLGLPEETPVEGIEEMYRGMLALCHEYGGEIIGGDVVRSPTLFVTVALTGHTDGPVLSRYAASPGDLVGVTGYLGSSGGGLRMIQQGLAFGEDVERRLREAHQKPRPQVAHGKTLLKEGVRAAMDISDGLVDDLSKLCKASGVGAIVHADKVPVDPLLKEVFPQDYLSMALGGGEDYELLFTAPQKDMVRVCSELGPPAAVIGEIAKDEPGSVKVVDENNNVMSIDGGWDHFR